jgi:hypothetical protein
MTKTVLACYVVYILRNTIHIPIDEESAQNKTLIILICCADHSGRLIQDVYRLQRLGTPVSSILCVEANSLSNCVLKFTQTI